MLVAGGADAAGRVADVAGMAGGPPGAVSRSSRRRSDDHTIHDARDRRPRRSATRLAGVPAPLPRITSFLHPLHPPPLSFAPPADTRLTNARPSAIYKVRGHLLPGVAPGTVANSPAQLGIEVATLGAVETAAQASAAKTGKGREVAQRVDVSLVAGKIVKNVSVGRGGQASRIVLRGFVIPSPFEPSPLSNRRGRFPTRSHQLFNYLHSFGGDVKLTPDTPIPLSVFQRWYDNFNRKIANDSGAAFLDRED